ncbi:MAG: exopolysaccharide Pel transporter PelG [Methylococcales bacterium]|nr:exopolysaccharide Pel transporter PelG [Methylococcales bacterium]
MAGIGFELRKLLRKDSFFGLIQAYGYAGIISSGPWILSILGVMVVGLLSLSLKTPASDVISFLVSITYLTAFSLITGGWLQLMLTRFIADRLFENTPEQILPNLMGALLVTTVGSFVIGLLFWPLFGDTSLMYRFLMVSSLIVLSDIWVLVIMMSGLRAYNKVLMAFAMGYGFTIALSLLLRRYGLEGLLGGFLFGQSIMMFWMLGLLVREFSASTLISFDFLDKHKVFYSLVAISVTYNLGVWADKFVFWFSPITSEAVIGPLRSSLIYDPPISLAYLSIIPGMAVFLLRMEADFVDRCQAFYTAITDGKTLVVIRQLKVDMIDTIRSSFFEIFKVQILTIIVLMLNANEILQLFNVSTNFRMLFSVDLIAVGMQIVLLSIFNVLFYLDKRHLILYLTLLFACSNFIFTWLSLYLDPEFYGFGFAIAIFITTVTGFVFLNKTLSQLEYETFMLQK